MPIDLKALCRQLKPEQATLLFGAGSSIPSGGLTGPQLASEIATHFKLDTVEDFSLADVSTVVERKLDRRQLIEFVRSVVGPLKATGAILNLPLFPWNAIYTTNYDTLLEQAYQNKGKTCRVYRSNFDFQIAETRPDIKIFKLHGSIEQDTVDGHKSRIIISNRDYDLTQEYRELLYKNFELSMTIGNLLIIGSSLQDPDLRKSIDEAVRVKTKSGAPGKIFLLLYNKDENRAIIYEDRGLEVCFGDLGAWMAELATELPPTQLVLTIGSDPLDAAPVVRPSTIDVSHALANSEANLLKMYNGRPANYGDLAQGWTFERDCSSRIETQLANDGPRIAYILGAAGVGKSTAVRQSLMQLSRRDVKCWEHIGEFALPATAWIAVDEELRKRREFGVLFIDDAHEHMREVNKLADTICGNEVAALKLVICSTRPHWNPRQKAMSIFAHGTMYNISRLSEGEINGLLTLLDREQRIRDLVEDAFLGYSLLERRRRLIERCSADMFVCLKNIFGSQSINNIILQEYASLSEYYQDLYRTIAAMESAGVRVHRQLIIRTLEVNTDTLAQSLDDLSEIIEEYTIDAKEGLYGWRVRHDVIAKIISDYKFADENELFVLFDNIISHLNPSYDIEIRTIRDMCDLERGIVRIRDRRRQNYLLRKMISLAPGQRVPRHRLIHNLIVQSEFEVAENEIRIFEKELRADGPLVRYKIKLQLRMADETKGIMNEDRAAIARRAATIAEAAIATYDDDKNMYRSYLEVGLSYFRYSGDWGLFDDAMQKAREAEGRILDPDLRRIISKFEAISLRIQQGT